MKKICILSTMMLFVMAILLPLNLNMLNAQTFYQNCSTGQCLRYSIKNDTMVSITGGSCMSGDLVIPSTVSHNGITYSVTFIRDNAFYGCSSLTSINIPNSVTSIGSYAFNGCSSLTSINIPDSVTSIDYYAFTACSSLSSITVDANNPVYDSRDNCNAIIRTSDNALIVGCQNTIIPNSVTSIGDYAFYGCSSLSSINIPDSVTSIGSYAFYGCSSLTSINIPESVTSIGSYAFDGCSGLTSVNIPNSVTSIGSCAFKGCSSLTSINIPNSVTYISSYAFDGCSSLSSITVDTNNPVYDSRDNCNAIISTINNMLIVGCQNTTIPNSVTSIGSYAFYGCSSLTSINIPNSVTSIGSYAFDGCSSLTSINIPNSVTSIGDGAFYGCSSLTSINIPDSVTSIGYGAFYGCSSLTSINIPNSVTYIGGSAFYGCSSLTSINIPNSVTFIGSSAFYGCSSLTSINIPNSVTFIGSYAFSGCSSLTSINIPNSVTSIDYDAFYGCSSLTSINIPNSVTFIGEYAFNGCSSLTSITVDANNTVYDSRDNCNALIRTIDNTLLTACKNTIIPASVTSIGNNAFYGNVGSDTIICLATTPPVLDGCACDFFADVPNDFRIIIPCGTLPDYRAAWSDSPYLLESGAGPGYDTSITVACPDSCYTWNGVDYCESGTYTQTLQTVHGCDSVVTLHLTIAVGIDDHNQGAAITVYPNPTSGVIHVQLTMNNVQLNNVEIQLYDAFGRLLQTTGGVRANNHSPLQTAQIDLSPFAPGIYFIKAVAESNVLAIGRS